MIVKAYEILTDPQKKENFEKYGDPDGPKSRLSYVLPEFFFNQKFHYPILFGFLFFIFGLAIYTVLYLKGNDEYDEHGNSRTNQSVYYYNLNENVQLKHIPFIIGLSIEFNNITLRNHEEGDLNSLWTMCKSYIPKIKSEQIPLANKKAITLIYAWFSRIETMSESLKRDSILITNLLLEVFPKMYNFANTVNNAKRINKRVKTFGYNCMKSLLEFSQCVHQRLWFDYSPYLQFPYLQDSDISNANKKMRKDFIPFNHFLRLDEKEKDIFLSKIKGDLSSENRKEIVDISNLIPIYEIQTEHYVAGLEDILINDVLTINITISRKINLLENEDSVKAKLGFLHSNYLNSDFSEQIVIFFKDSDGKLLEDRKIDINDWRCTTSFSFIPREANSYHFQVEVCSFNYKGLDTVKDINFTVYKSSSKRSEHFKKIEEIDKKEDYNEQSNVQKMLQNIVGVEEEELSSGEENN
eukprot:CAMPEP_0170519622 /NCGR_PEP_ID=MMETSP0209-20121228/4973_1 /TAXON_ID=665100 ORGANISM="Litonotus pictus, Strain P1" /NCGR_SAMPLE_ID=MMETSP0209 /ASSEMBLY_ACC=CAM_ASM_000301 /LENGTH=467 /DNA_ID=CAMNT_0010805559 /DNA_START=530 /DNA_END=1933 /DNA_ORIENTATION=-